MVSNEDLEKFVSQKYHWKTMLPHDQMAMAKELLEYRKQSQIQIEQWREDTRLNREALTKAGVLKI